MYEHNLNWNCKEEKKCYIEHVLPNWAIFNKCFIPTKIKITDIDGVVERNGWFLFIELKERKKEIPTGQHILFEKLTETSDRITVLLLYAQGAAKDMNIREYAMYQKGNMIRDWRPTNTEKITGMITRWFQRANKSQQW